MSNNYSDEVWFTSENGFNRSANSPGAAGNFYESENIDNIPLAEASSPVFDFESVQDDYPYVPSGLTPNSAQHGQHQHPGTSNDDGGQFQSMHSVHGNDFYDMSSSTVEYNNFERPTVVSGNIDAGPYQELGIVDPYYTAQPSTVHENGMISHDYEMIGPSTSSYSSHMDHVDPSSIGNPLSQSGTNQQQQLQGMNDGAPVQQLPPKPKPKKKAPPKKKPLAATETSVGDVLSTASKLSQRENNNENGSEKLEMTVSIEDMPIIGKLMAEMQMLKNQEGYDNKNQIADLEAQLAQIFSKNVSNANSGGSKIVNQIKSVANTAPMPQQQMTAPPKKAPPKKSRSQVSKNVQQQPQNQRQQGQPVVVAQAQMTSTKIMMEPPTTTMVPSQMNKMYNENGSDNYGSYQQMDEPGTSQQYSDYHQPQSHESMQYHQNQGPSQVIHAKVVPTMNQRTHNYRQAVIFTSQNNSEPGPSPQFNQPQSHESNHMEQKHDHQQYHGQDHQRPQSQQMYAPLQNQQEVHMYQHQDEEPTVGEIVRQTHGSRYQSQDAPHLRQQLSGVTTNKPVMQRSTAPTPSPGNFHNNGLHQQQYAEPYQSQGSYPASHDMQPQSHSQQGYESHCETSNDFYQGFIQRPGSQMMNAQQEVLQQQHYEQRDMYMPVDNQQQGMEAESEPEIEYPVPEASEALTREQLLEKLAEKSRVREEAVTALMVDQRNRLEAPDVTPFKSKMDILQRMLPYHHFSVGEEPVANFESTYQKTMTEAISRADVLGKRVRNIVLHDSMHSMEWERNMILFMETESERRKLEEDRKLAEQNPREFLQSSEIIQAVKSNRLNLDLSMQSAPQMPEHLKDLELPDGALSAVYEEFEFDSYDENRPRGSPLPFINEKPEWESESESEPEPESEQEEERISQIGQSPVWQSASISEIPSTSRVKNESVSLDSAKLGRISEPLSHEVSVMKVEFNKPERFSFGKISDAAQKQEQHRIKHSHISESLGSSDESTSSEDTPQPVQHQTAATSLHEQMLSSRSMLPPNSVPSTSDVSVTPVHIRRPMTYDEGSPEIDEDYSMSPPERAVPVEEIPPIPLPVPVHMIKEEKEDSPKLKLRVPVAIIQKGIEMAASEDDEDIPSTHEKRIPLKLKLNRKDIKLEEPSPDREVSAHSSASSRVEARVSMNSEQIASSKSVFKTPLKTPLKPTSESRKRKRSEKIVETPQQSETTESQRNNFMTPKNGLIHENSDETGRFLRTMTDGRKLVMKIGKIPNNINHFVTPRRDSKGNMHKDLRATPDTRLKMRWFKNDGRLAVEVTEHFPKTQATPQLQGPNHLNASSSIVPTPAISTTSVKARPAPASRKGSVEIAGKDKKTNSIKSKNTFCNRFNPFANVSKPKPPTVPTSTVTPTAGSMKMTAGSSSSTLPQQKTTSAPIALTTPKRVDPKVISSSQTSLLTNLIKTTPVVPKITVSQIPSHSGHSFKTEKPSEVNNKANSLLPWLFESSEKPKTVKPQPPPVSSFLSSIFPSTNHLQVVAESAEGVAITPQQESPRANSSLSFFDDEKGNGFPFLRSPKRTNEPLPVVEFSDDDEGDLAHSTFSHATDHLLQASKMNKPVNGTTPILPWSNNP